MIKKLHFALFILATLTSALEAQTDGSVTWYLDWVDTVGGYAAAPIPKTPRTVDTPYGKAILFSCYDSTGLMMSNCNPLGSDTAFTIEVFFRPDSTVLAGANNEQRFVHIRNSANDNRRILMEIRVFTNQQWVFDTYIKSETNNITLVDSLTPHTLGAWHHVAMTYGNATMKQYVDGALLRTGNVTYLPINVNPRTSIGARQDPRSWFNGAIRMVKFTKRVLIPSEFTVPNVVDVKSEPAIPLNRCVLQSYPNPFNPSTQLKFSVAKTGWATLKVVNVLGQEVAILFSDNAVLGQKYSCIFNAAGLSSGIYFARLESKGPLQVQKLVLAK
jgi:hypothetical protein